MFLDSPNIAGDSFRGKAALYLPSTRVTVSSTNFSQADSSGELRFIFSVQVLILKTSQLDLEFFD